MKDVSSTVEHLLKGSERLRNSDKELLIAFWHDQGLILDDQQVEVFLHRCTPAESITRARRALRDKYPGSKDIEEERYNLMKENQDKYSPKAVSWLND